MDKVQLPQAAGPLQRESLLLTTKFPRVLGTYLFDLRRMKGLILETSIGFDS